jgi:hypothetical protein
MYSVSGSTFSTRLNKDKKVKDRNGEPERGE